MRSRCGRRAFRASPIRCVGERIMATGVPEFREVAWRACLFSTFSRHVLWLLSDDKSHLQKK
ncbi:hypothetical protein [Bathymodiolus japonicus methanotrophic gill symbiont]|uniref:hypothetical protein n=1 Tax=Bathymodiolus japonicus methanotrophic gill symbiont TaxID=113269 RepID=UPI001C8D0E57|nr:hypothetical protein [Bathymodiolus japonicus methanotrophic gill symbiont]